MVTKNKTLKACRKNEKITFKRFVITLSLIIGAMQIYAQKVAVKTNTLMWLTATPNLEAEFILGSHVSLSMGIAVNPINTNNLKTTFTHFQPEVRYWINRPMVSHFVGLTAFTNSFDLMINSKYYKGDAAAAGLTYGYAWIIGKHWNMEVTAGVGVLKYRKFEYEKGMPKPDMHDGRRTVIAPVKLGLSFAYIIQ